LKYWHQPQKEDKTNKQKKHGKNVLITKQRTNKQTKPQEHTELKIGYLFEWFDVIVNIAHFSSFC